MNIMLPIDIMLGLVSITLVVIGLMNGDSSLIILTGFFTGLWILLIISGERMSQKATNVSKGKSLKGRKAS